MPRRRAVLVGCLVFSGLAALVYQIIWTRLLGFTFGTTSEAIGAVLAVFFAGMALGNLLAARWLTRVHRPLRLYALLELGIGVFALLSLPLLQRLDGIHAWLGAEHGPLATVAIRLAVAGAILLPPTSAMGATLPVVARGLVGEDRTLGRWSAILYAANTLGAVLGAYVCGFWLIPGLGLTRSVWTAGIINIVVAATVLALVRGREGARAPEREPQPAPPASLAAPAQADELGRPERAAFLAFFALSGFVAIGYEIVWARVFGIVMEGTLYGFSAVLASYLLGIGLGSLVMARGVDRIRDLPRAFGLLHAAIALAVSLGTVAIPFLPWANRRLGDWLPGADGLHPLFLLVLPLVLLPTALFGAAFPILIRIYTRRARTVGQGMGVATGINTAGSIVASLWVGFWAIPTLGTDATLFALLLLELAVALVVLVGFQGSRGRPRFAASGTAVAALLLVSLSYDGVHVQQAVAGREVQNDDLAGYEAGLERLGRSLAFWWEGRSSIVTVYDQEGSRLLRTNGLPEAGVGYGPPYYSLEAVLLGVLPTLLAEAPERALVIGLGGGNTVRALLDTDVAQVEAVELEPGVAEAVRHLYAGRPSPLDDPRVTLRVDDGRHRLLLERHRGGGRFDVIASQPSHPWLQGAANLFTEEYFALAKENLSEDGIFALWVNGFRTDVESLLAIATSFARVFPDGFLVNGVRLSSRVSLLFLGGHGPLELDLDALERSLSEPDLGARLATFDIHDVSDLLALFEAPVSAVAAIEPGAANTDDNAFVETRIPRQREWSVLAFQDVERRLPADTPVLPTVRGAVDVEAVAESLVEADGRDTRATFDAKMERLLRSHGADLDPVIRATLQARTRLGDPEQAEAALAALETLRTTHPERPEPWRALAHYAAVRERAFAEAAARFAEAWKRSAAPQDAYDAGRALHHVDPAAAWAWFERVPADARERFPRLAFYAAERALARGADADELRSHQEALLRFRDTEEGRRLPGIDGLAARLALALGDERDARAYADADRRERRGRAAPLERKARRLLAAQRLDEAATALAESRALLPGDPSLNELQARLALARRDPQALAAALNDLRRFAPSLEEAVGTENRLRASLGLPLLPDLPAEALTAER